MKVLIQLLILNDGKLEKGRKAWITRDDKNRLIVSSIYTTKDTAHQIDSMDLKELKKAEKHNSFKILEVFIK